MTLMTKAEFIAVLERVLDADIVAGMMKARIPIPTIIGVAAKELFIRREINTDDANAVRYQLERLQQGNPMIFTE
jgi:hypothetical protein